jgi:hypothetical protein
MKGTAMTNYSIENSPQMYARTGGALYLIIIVLGIFGEVFVRSTIIAAGDPAATAANLRAMESLWRVGVATEFLALMCTVLLAMIYYFLLRPVSKELNLLATLFRMTSVVVQAVAVINLITALFPLTNASYLQSFAPDQLAVLSSLAIRSHTFGFNIALLFTGYTFLFHGYLIFRSGYLPRALGVLIFLAGLGYLTNSFVLILYPAATGTVFPIVVLPVLAGEVSMSLWLLIKGVNLPKWREKIGLAAG